MLHSTILSPLNTLTSHSVHLGETDDLLSRLTLNRKDEIGVLANAFDQMIDRLAETRRKLVDQSFYAGIAEMASGVLHNIGNAVTPLQGQVLAVKDELQKAPAEEMKIAVRELADASTPMDRRNDLARFVELAGSEMAKSIDRTRKLAADITAQVEYIHRILADQERYSRAARVLEPLAMDALVLDSVHTLPLRLQAAMTVEVDPGVSQVGQVVASRAALQQVIGNLLINAAESIIESGEAGGRLLVSATREPVEGTPMAHFRFEDNGGGIQAEHLSRMFERNFSTKGRNSGLGLHWSSNTISAFRGRLYARNNEGKQGACLHLLLPLAVVQEGTTQA
jgi:signal transduction histidine kinase